MKYKRNQYTEGFSICGLIIAGGFIVWGISWIARRVFPFSFIPGIIFLLIGLSIIGGNIAALMNRSKLRNAVKYEFEANPNATIEEIQNKTGISRKDVQAIILDLKSSGQLRGQFSATTGQMEPAPIITEKTPDQGKAKFCPACGSAVSKASASFCSYCGAKIE